MEDRNRRILRKIGEPIFNFGCDENMINIIRGESEEDINTYFNERGVTITDKVKRFLIEKLTLISLKNRIARSKLMYSQEDDGSGIDYDLWLDETTKEIKQLYDDMNKEF